MENISKSQLEKIAGQVSALIDETNQAVDWADKFLKEDIRKATNDKVKKHRRDLKKIGFALSENPSAALYGESQVGKSYLIKNLLSKGKGSFTITDESTGGTHDFLEEINPKGEGTEATSVVTRFSTQVDIIDRNYPIRIRLLSPKDIILMLCDSYFSDVEDHVSLPKTDTIREYIKGMELSFSQYTIHQDALSEDDVYDIKDYMEQHFRSFTMDIVNSNYWDVVATLIHKVDSSNWYKVFDILWGRNVHINDIFNKLIDQLARLDFAAVAYAEFKSVLREYGTLLHVARLREINGSPLFEDVKASKYQKDVAVIVPNTNGNSHHTIHKSILCALSAELVFKVDKSLETEKPFLRQSDLLDFPGARSRLKNQEIKLNETHIGDMVLRGKVSYIFNRYSSQYLISSLLFCNKNLKIEVKYIPKLLNTWIETYIGKTPRARKEFLASSAFPPLFVIYTFFNADLEFNPINDREDTLAEKWTKRFNTIFENEIVTNNFNWHKSWTEDVNSFFQNNYLLRDFHYSNTVFEGFRETGEESDTPMAIGKIDGYIEKLRQSFLGHDFVQHHFSNPEEAWDEAASPNKDGSALIIRNLTAVSNNRARTEKFKREVNQIALELKLTMEQHYHSDEADQRIQKAAAQAGSIHLSMDICFGQDPYAFGRFIKGFVIRESAVYNFYKDKLTQLEMIDKTNLNAYVLIRNSNLDLSITKSYDENIQVLMKTYTLGSKEEVETHFAEEGISLQELFYGEANQLKKNSLVLAEALRDFWFLEYLQKERFTAILAQGFSSAGFDHLINNIRTAFEKQGIVREIAAGIREYVDRFEKIDVAEEMIADISAGIINKFITRLGWDFYSDSELANLKATNEANDLGLNFDVEDAPDYSETADLAEFFDHLDKYDDFINERNFNHSVIKNFPNIRNYSKWRDQMKISFIANCNIPTYDIMANNALGEWLRSIDRLHANIIGEVQ